ncbi:hypothetical protein [Dyadobacter sp. CY312]|uniref:hypothetical protein n=1 Tax=Dyadobacter sp. CY312 TaxID=2907303 RepID=UPI001F3AEFD0|nr:hypothetical protein [Dyadobacter sp. CY312]MCE7039217.1 hypothetical protein [Dyadobacter sp. CY312]
MKTIEIEKTVKVKEKVEIVNAVNNFPLFKIAMADILDYKCELCGELVNKRERKSDTCHPLVYKTCTVLELSNEDILFVHTHCYQQLP